MKNRSLKMYEKVFLETEKTTFKNIKSRNKNIKQAGEIYNLLQKRKIISRQLQRESRIVQEESIKVLSEFVKLQDENESV